MEADATARQCAAFQRFDDNKPLRARRDPPRSIAEPSDRNLREKSPASLPRGCAADSSGGTSCHDNVLRRMVHYGRTEATSPVVRIIEVASSWLLPMTEFVPKGANQASPIGSIIAAASPPRGLAAPITSGTRGRSARIRRGRYRPDPLTCSELAVPIPRQLVSRAMPRGVAPARSKCPSHSRSLASPRTL